MFHSVELRAYCHATEEEDRVARALQTLSPDAPKVERTEGHHGNPILLMECRIADRDGIANFWGRIKEAGVLPQVLEGLQDRIDGDAVLHLRIDKQRAFAGAIELARHDDVISVRAKVAAHPANRATALRSAREYLQRV